MKKSIILFLILSISLSANAAEYTNENTQPCPQNKELVCSLKNKPITGVLNGYYYGLDDGTLRFEVNYKAGKKEGLVKFYFGNRNLAAEANYKNGKLDGLRKMYYGNGNLQTEENYKNGKLDGLRKTYYQNGRLKSKIVFKEGKVISGFIYNEYGEKREMTNAQLHNMNMRY